MDYESQYVDVTYDLETGALATCNLPTDVDPDRSWHEVSEKVYLDDQCEGTAYGGVDHPADSRTVIWAEGKAWLYSTENCFTALSYGVNQVFDLCVEGEVGLVCPFEEVPDWVQNLLPNPPYTLEMAYD